MSKKETVHTSVRVYNCGDYVVHGVPDSYLETHIEYNVNKRGGCALFINGKCRNKGYLDAERIAAFEARIKAEPETFVRTVASLPMKQGITEIPRHFDPTLEMLKLSESLSRIKHQK